MPNLKRPSYPNGLLDSPDNAPRRRKSHRFSRSNVPILPSTVQEQRFRPVLAQYRPLGPNSKQQLWARSRVLATPHQRLRQTEALDAFQYRSEQLTRHSRFGQLEYYALRMPKHSGCRARLYSDDPLNPSWNSR